MNLMLLSSDCPTFCWQVVAFNETPVRNLKHLANMVEKCTDPFLRFDLEYQQVIFYMPGCAFCYVMMSWSLAVVFVVRILNMNKGYDSQGLVILVIVLLYCHMWFRI